MILKAFIVACRRYNMKMTNIHKVFDCSAGLRYREEPPQGDSMAKSREIRARVDTLFASKVEAWAEENGYKTVSDYLRDLIERDIAGGGMKAGRKADQLSELTAEMNIMTGLMVGRMLAQAIGDDEAKKFEQWAREVASGHIGEELAKMEP